MTRRPPGGQGGGGGGARPRLVFGAGGEAQIEVGARYPSRGKGVGTLSTVDDAGAGGDVGGGPPLDDGTAGPAVAPGYVDRVEILEQQVRQLTSRLAGWVEAQLIRAVDDRRNEMKVLRSELQLVVNEQLAGARAEVASLVNVEARRLEAGQEQLGERLDAMATRASEAVATTVALAGSASTEPERVDRLEALVSRALSELAAVKAAGDAVPDDARLDAFEQRVKAAMGRLSDSVEGRLVEVTSSREAELMARLDHLEHEASAVLDGSTTAQQSAQAARDHAELLEKQVKAALARLEEAVDARVADLGTVRDADVVAHRAGEVAHAEGLASLRAEVGAVQERADALEQRVKAAIGRLAESVEARVAGVTAATPADVVAVREEIEEAFASQLRDARAEISTAVADAHRRFLVSVDTLEERMSTLADESAAVRAALGDVVAVQETVSSDGRRIEALEVHTRRTDARLGEVVDAKLSELAGQRGADIDGLQRQFRAALDAHLTATRAEVTLALGEYREQLAAAVADLARRRDDLAALGARLDESRAEMSRVASLTGKLGQVQDQIQGTVATVAQRVEFLASTAAGEGGSLAPLRSDVRQLQAQVADLAEALAEAQARRRPPSVAKKPPPPSPPAPATAPARKVAAPAKTVAAPAKKVTPPAKKVVPAKKVAAPARKVAAPAKKVAAAARKVVVPAPPAVPAPLPRARKSAMAEAVAIARAATAAPSRKAAPAAKKTASAPKAPAARRRVQ